jgi:hypothetical protein
LLLFTVAYFSLKITRLLNTSLADFKSQLQNVTDTVRDHIKNEKGLSLHLACYVREGTVIINKSTSVLIYTNRDYMYIFNKQLIKREEPYLSTTIILYWVGG